MDRIAVIADIHGNIPALKAVLADIYSRKISRIMCLGDIIGKGPDSEKAVDMCKEACEVIVKGNWDHCVANTKGQEWVDWYRQQIGEERLEYLNQQDFVKEFYLSGRLVRLFHANPHDVNKRIFQTSPREELQAMFDIPKIQDGKFEPFRSDIVGYADIHSAYIKSFDNGIIFNAGSVGNPLDIAQASYVILEGKYDCRELSSISVQFVRVPYDIESAVQDTENIDIPMKELYVKELRTAVYCKRNI